MKNLIFYFGISLLLTSCGSKEKKPNYLWKEDRFVDALVEMQKAEAIIRLGYYKEKDTIYSTDSVYSAALRKVDASKADFDSNYNYYLDHPKKFEKIYDRVIVQLSEASALIEKEKKKPILDSTEKVN